MIRWSTVFVALLLVAILCAGCGTDSNNRDSPDGAVPAPPSGVNDDLSNITNKEVFALSDAAAALVVKNGFVVVPDQYREFFTLYEMNRYQSVPLLVTTDSLLHNYHLFFDHLLKEIETEHLIKQLKRLSHAMLEKAQQQYELAKGTAWETAAKRNIGFFAVGTKLLDPDTVIPSEIQVVVSAELDLISKHQEIALSPLMNLGSEPDPLTALHEDYTQYIPRGHYVKSRELENYFKAMMWYGRLTFRLNHEDETKSAVLIALALSDDDNFQRWQTIYEPTAFFVGKSDDICYPELKDCLDLVYSGTDLSTLVLDKQGWDSFLEASAKLRPSAVNSIPIFDETIHPDREREIKGFRFLGQRFTIDAAIFQRLVYREVKENKQGERRMLPKGLDIPAAFGSAEAYQILNQMGDTDYELYPENMAKVKQHLANLDQENWTENLYWNWLYALKPLTEDKTADYPAFMRNSAWARKELNTFLGSWTELKHDTVLYAKQVYAEAGGGGMPVDDRGYVEPNPVVFGRLAALANSTKEGLMARQLIGERDIDSLLRLEQLSIALQNIADKELQGQPLTDDDYELIRSYGVQLEHFWLEALRNEGVDHPSQSYDQPAAIVADVATDVGGRVLQEATGFVSQIYAAVPVEGELRLAVGGVYSYYEFVWPIDDRLTDIKWREMLNAGQAPPLPQWTEAFTTP